MFENTKLTNNCEWHHKTPLNSFSTFSTFKIIAHKKISTRLCLKIDDSLSAVDIICWHSSAEWVDTPTPKWETNERGGKGFISSLADGRSSTITHLSCDDDLLALPLWMGGSVSYFFHLKWNIYSKVCKYKQGME